MIPRFMEWHPHGGNFREYISVLPELLWNSLIDLCELLVEDLDFADAILDQMYTKMFLPQETLHGAPIQLDHAIASVDVWIMVL